MDKLKIARINELYKKSKTEGLTEKRKSRNSFVMNIEWPLLIIFTHHLIM